jgi:tRNA(Arg) A34 adenosine deaminase TadA
MNMNMSKRHDITAIIYDKRGNVLSIGKNSYIKTHTLQAKYAKEVGEDYKIYLHAEIHAITRCAKIESAHKIVITRYDSNGSPVNSKPCRVCQEAIKHTKIKVIQHT